MLFALPLQLSWAAAAVYCQHESSVKITHFGHHQHEHQHGAETNKGEPHSIQVDNDCGYCHAVSQVSFLIMPAAVIFASASSHDALSRVTFSSHIPDGPRRPDRQPVV